MLLILAITNILSFTSASEQDTTAFLNTAADRNGRGLSNVHGAFNNPLIYNNTYLDKEDNVLRMPTKYADEYKSKKKIKKTPKRTVQKIIKKNQYKSKKLYMYPPTPNPTMASNPEQDEDYTRNDFTTEANFRKKQRKNTKYVRYSMPFQKLQRKDGIHSRYRREDRDLYIINHFNEMKFLSSEKDHNKVIAHVQKHW